MPLLEVLAVGCNSLVKAEVREIYNLSDLSWRVKVKLSVIVVTTHDARLAVAKDRG